MAKQLINIGQAANDRSGDPLRTAFSKINANFTELYTAIGNGEFVEFGNFQFVDNQLRNINGGSINNSDASHGSTAYINFPANGSGNTEVLNYYGGLSVSTSASGVGQLKTWTFEQTGGLTFPDNTTQTTAYLGENLEIDGGNASTNYTAELTIDGGGA